jgi:hypothetical protein
MRRRRPASVSTIAKVGTGGKSRLVFICEGKCGLMAKLRGHVSRMARAFASVVPGHAVFYR